jgi:hypothetical protein
MSKNAALLCVLSLGLAVSACGTSARVSQASKGSSSSRDNATQMNLRDALKASDTAYRENSDFSLAAPPQLRDIAPSLSFVAPDLDVAAGTNQVSVSNGGDNSNQTVTLAALSTTGTCWYLVEVATSASATLTGTSGIRAPGVWYGHANDAASVCTAPDSGPPMAANLLGGWNNSHF